MSIEYNTSNKKKHLHIQSHGESDDIEVIGSYVREITDICKQRGYKRMLVDERNREYKLREVLDLYKLANFFNTLDITKLQIAVICQPQFLDQIRFLETTTNNHGINLKFFVDLDSAKRWLL